MAENIIDEGPRFDRIGGEWKQIFNQFDKPVMCPPGTDTRKCCEPCQAWLDCLNRVPFRLDLSGFDFEKWFKWVRFNAEAWFVEENIAHFFSPDGQPVNIGFEGTFIAEPFAASQATINQSQCGSVALTEGCGTHLVRGGRSVATPNGYFSKVKQFYLAAKVECVRCIASDRDQACLQFSVWLNYEQEVSSADGEVDCSARKSSPGGVERGCCKLLVSDPIPMAGLVWGALKNIKLNPSECTRQGDLFGGRSCHDVSDFASTPYHAALMIHEIIGCGPGIDGVVNECDPEANWNCELSQTSDPKPFASGTICGTPPIKVIGEENGTDANFLSVLAESCTFAQNCEFCPQDPNAPNVPAKPTHELDFVYSETGCCKQFTAIVPECWNIPDENFFWSWGATGKQVFHCLQNADASAPTQPIEQVTLIAYDPVRNCRYCKTRSVGCDCPCPGAGGGITVGQVGPPEDCRFEVSASVTDGVGGDCPGGAFIEFCLSGPGFVCNYDDSDCRDCIKVDPHLPPCSSCCFSLANGQSTQFTIQGSAILRWRVWDKLCGCPGQWSEQKLDCGLCQCCTGPIKGAVLTVAGLGPCVGGSPALGSDCGCESANRAYDVPTTGGCAGEKTFENVVLCGFTNPETAVWQDGTLRWSIFCDEAGYWLHVDVDFPGPGFCGFGGSGTKFLGTEKPICNEIIGSITITNPPVFNGCDHSSFSVGYEFY